MQRSSSVPIEVDAAGDEPVQHRRAGMLRCAGDGRTSMLIERIHIGAALREPPRQIGMPAPDRGGETAIDIARELDQQPRDGALFSTASKERRYVLVVARIVIGAGREQGVDAPLRRRARPRARAVSVRDSREC